MKASFLDSLIEPVPSGMLRLASPLRAHTSLTRSSALGALSEAEVAAVEAAQAQHDATQRQSAHGALAAVHPSVKRLVQALVALKDSMKFVTDVERLQDILGVLLCSHAADPLVESSVPILVSAAEAVARALDTLEVHQAMKMKGPTERCAGFFELLPMLIERRFGGEGRHANKAIEALSSRNGDQRAWCDLCPTLCPSPPAPRAGAKAARKSAIECNVCGAIFCSTYCSSHEMHRVVCGERGQHNVATVEAEVRAGRLNGELEAARVRLLLRTGKIALAAADTELIEGLVRLVAGHPSLLLYWPVMRLALATSCCESEVISAVVTAREFAHGKGALYITRTLLAYDVGPATYVAVEPWKSAQWTPSVLLSSIERNPGAVSRDLELQARFAAFFDHPVMERDALLQQVARLDALMMSEEGESKSIHEWAHAGATPELWGYIRLYAQCRDPYLPTDQRRSFTETSTMQNDHLRKLNNYLQPLNSPTQSVRGFYAVVYRYRQYGSFTTAAEALLLYQNSYKPSEPCLSDVRPDDLETQLRHTVTQLSHKPAQDSDSSSEQESVPAAAEAAAQEVVLRGAIDMAGCEALEGLEEAYRQFAIARGHLLQDPEVADWATIMSALTAAADVLSNCYRKEAKHCTDPQQFLAWLPGEERMPGESDGELCTRLTALMAQEVVFVHLFAATALLQVPAAGSGVSAAEKAAWCSDAASRLQIASAMSHRSGNLAWKEFCQQLQVWVPIFAFITPAISPSSTQGVLLCERAAASINATSSIYTDVLASAVLTYLKSEGSVADLRGLLKGPDDEASCLWPVLQESTKSEVKGLLRTIPANLLRETFVYMMIDLIPFLPDDVAASCVITQVLEFDERRLWFSDTLCERLEILRSMITPANWQAFKAAHPTPSPSLPRPLSSTYPSRYSSRSPYSSLSPYFSRSPYSSPSPPSPPPRSWNSDSNRQSSGSDTATYTDLDSID